MTFKFLLKLRRLLHRSYPCDSNGIVKVQLTVVALILYDEIHVPVIIVDFRERS